VNAALVNKEVELFIYSASNCESHPAGQEEAASRAVTGILRKIAFEFPAPV
jgi:hypothetical protein